MILLMDTSIYALTSFMKNSIKWGHICPDFFPEILLFLQCQCQLLDMPFPFLNTKYLQVIFKNTVLLVPHAT